VACVNWGLVDFEQENVVDDLAAVQIDADGRQLEGLSKLGLPLGQIVDFGTVGDPDLLAQTTGDDQADPGIGVFQTISGDPSPNVTGSFVALVRPVTSRPAKLVPVFIFGHGERTHPPQNQRTDHRNAQEYLIHWDDSSETQSIISR